MLHFIVDNIEYNLIEFLPRNTEKVFQLTQKNYNHLIEYMDWIHGLNRENNLEQMKKLMKEKGEGKNYRFLISKIIDSENKILGVISIERINHSNFSGMIGYWIDKEYEGKKIMTEALKTLIKYCFDYLGLLKINIRCSTKNKRSRKVILNNNFREIGILEKDVLINNIWHDSYIFELINPNFIKENYHYYFYQN